ncbi:mechanosensitive ion channel family protein [Chloroflexota bacterium]
MVEWFNVASVWVLAGAGTLFSILLLFRTSIEEKLLRLGWFGRKKKSGKTISIILWIIETALLVIIVLALTAIVRSREGAKAIITTQIIQEWLLVHGTSILIIIIIAVISWAILQRVLPVMIGHSMVRTKGESRDGVQRRRKTLTSVLVSIGKVLVILITIIMILEDLNVPIGPLLAGFGIAGVAVGFGAQWLIRDYIAGMFILMENQYRVGDVAKIADIAGLVEEITLRKTVLRDLDGIVHHVPNGEIKVASNYARHFARVNLDISVSYGTDLEYAISVINRICAEMAEEEQWASVIQTVPQVLRVNKLGDSGIDIKILGDVKPLQQWSIMGELRLRIKNAFDKVGIEIPWPHTKVYFGNSQQNDEEKGNNNELQED